VEAIMKRVTGVGGIFFKGKDPAALKAWYEKHLGISRPEGFPEGVPPMFEWRDKDNPDKEGQTVFEVFPADTDYFEPSKSPFMFNFRVDNLDALLDVLRKEGVTVDPKVMEDSIGKFAWIMDPEGNRIELWEPAEES
jgi:predicted enzyme related to lactoylglutathione lyase